MVRFVKGDMFAGAYDIRVNTVNCVGVMGAGVALAFKERYPDMYRTYRAACDAGQVRPGKVEVWRTLTEWIVNFPTKRHWRQKSRYEDIDSGLKSLREYLSAQGRVSVALPALGCGHGGLDWERVRPMIEQALGDLDADVVVFEPADSIELGRRTQLTKAAQVGLEFHEVSLVDANFPAKLRLTEVPRLSVLGPIELVSRPAAAMLVSRSPGNREESAAMACAEALASMGVTLALTFGSALAHQLAVVAAAQSGAVLLWATEGTDRLKVPAALRTLIQEKRAAIVTAVTASESWSVKRAEQAVFLQVLASRAVLLTAPRPVWPPPSSLQAQGIQFPPVFFLRYDLEDNQASALLRTEGAHPVGRNRSTGLPNITQIVETVGLPPG